MSNFDPNAPAHADAGIFGLPYTAEDAEIVLIPVPWEVTVSYGGGTSGGPEAIFKASGQVDLFHHDFPELWRRGIWMEPVSAYLRDIGLKAKVQAREIISAIEQGQDPESDAHLADLYRQVNDACIAMNTWVKERTSYWISQGKKVGLIGGDHSTPLGFFKVQSEQHERFGLLVIDAHLDLRQAYEDFTFSHASIFYNALETLPNISRLVQVGIRDYCEEEKLYATQQGDRAVTWYDRDMRRLLFGGVSWDSICREIVDTLPDKVHISFDIDGLDPKLCPHTGTPVPGGLQYEECMHLLNVLKASGKTIIGFDLCEVSPGEDDWDGNVGARVLFHLCGLLS
jgi:agmatinase